jgi:hypothetical protein
MALHAADGVANDADPVRDGIEFAGLGVVIV